MLNYSMLAAKITENFNLYFTSLSYTPVNFSLLNKEENFWKKYHRKNEKLTCVRVHIMQLTILTLKMNSKSSMKYLTNRIL